MAIREIVREPFKLPEILRDNVCQVNLVALSVHVIDTGSLFGFRGAALAEFIRHDDSVDGGGYCQNYGDYADHEGGLYASRLYNDFDAAASGNLIPSPELRRDLNPVRIERQVRRSCPLRSIVGALSSHNIRDCHARQLMHRGPLYDMGEIFAGSDLNLQHIGNTSGLLTPLPFSHILHYAALMCGGFCRLSRFRRGRASRTGKTPRYPRFPES